MQGSTSDKIIVIESTGGVKFESYPNRMDMIAGQLYRLGLISRENLEKLRDEIIPNALKTLEEEWGIETSPIGR